MTFNKNEKKEMSTTKGELSKLARMGHQLLLEIRED